MSLPSSVLCCGGFVWRLVFVYNEYKLGKGVATNDVVASQSALYMLAMMRGIGRKWCSLHSSNEIWLPL